MMLRPKNFESFQQQLKEKASKAEFEKSAFMKLSYLHSIILHHTTQKAQLAALPFRASLQAAIGLHTFESSFCDTSRGQYW